MQKKRSECGSAGLQTRLDHVGQMGSKKVSVGQMVTKKSDHWGSDGFQKRSDHGGQMGYKKVIHVTKRSDHGVRWVTKKVRQCGTDGLQ